MENRPNRIEEHIEEKPAEGGKKKRKKRIFTKTAVCFMAFGLLLMLVGSALGAKPTMAVANTGLHMHTGWGSPSGTLFNIGPLSVGRYAAETSARVILDETFITDTVFKSVEVRVLELDVTVVAAETFGYIIEHASGRDIQVTYENNILRIEDKTTSGALQVFSLFGINIWTGSGIGSGGYVQIFAPPRLLDTLSVHTITGNIQVTGVNAAAMRLETVSGTVHLQDAVTASLSVKTVSGGVGVEGSLGGHNEIETVSGAVVFYSDLPQSAFNVTWNTVSGAMNLDRVMLRGNNVVTNTEEGRATHTLRIKTISGNTIAWFGTEVPVPTLPPQAPMQTPMP
jgi:hypothetical protein